MGDLLLGFVLCLFNDDLEMGRVIILKILPLILILLSGFCVLELVLFILMCF